LLTCHFGAYAGSLDPPPFAGDDQTPPHPSKEGGDYRIVLPSPRQGETPRPHGQEGAPEPPKSGEMGDPITISDESGDGPRLTDTHATDKGVETLQVEGQTPWPIGLHSVEEKRKKDEEERRKEEDKEEQHSLQGQLQHPQEVQV